MTASARNLLISIISLIITGHILANVVKGTVHAWLWPVLYYGAWMLISIGLFLKKKEMAILLRPGKQNWWYIIPVLIAVPVFIFVFLPNSGILHWNYWLLLNVILCLI